MNIREAILMAADTLERHPDLWRWSNCHVPACDTPGCAVGWIGHFAGCEVRLPIDVVAKEKLGLPHDGYFYDRMNDLVGRPWSSDLALCVKGLRLYADKYHPRLFRRRQVPPAPVKTPNWEAIAAQPLDRAVVTG